MSDGGIFGLQRVKALKYLCINHRDQGFLQFYVIRLSVGSFCSILIHMLWVYGHYYFLIISVRGQNMTSRRQILMSTDGPRAERVTHLYASDA